MCVTEPGSQGQDIKEPEKSGSLRTFSLDDDDDDGVTPHKVTWTHNSPPDSWGTRLF